MENNKDKDNQPSFNNPINWKSLGFFSSEEYLIYIFKKTEKITSALYLISGLLKDSEPLKWELRDRGIDLVSSSFMASSSVPGDKSSIIRSLFTAALETLSLLNVARVSNLISEMNHRILVREIDNVVKLLKERLAENAENAGYVLSESFFKTPELFASGFRIDEKSKNVQDTVHRQQNVKSGSNKEIPGDESSQVKKSKRQDVILELLRTKSQLTIKDFAQTIKDCSEKTIQRELLQMVEKGIIKKEGERRWSRYSLNS